MAWAQISHFKVKTKLKDRVVETFRDILSKNDDALVLAFMKKSNLIGNEWSFKFEDMMYLLKNKEFFIQCVDILWQWRIYNHKVWEFGFLHKHDLTISELLQRTPDFLQKVGPFFKTTLITSDDEDI